MVSAFQATSSLSGIHVYRPFLHMWNVFQDPLSVEFQEYIGRHGNYKRIPVEAHFHFIHRQEMHQTNTAQGPTECHNELQHCE